MGLGPAALPFRPFQPAAAAVGLLEGPEHPIGLHPFLGRKILIIFVRLKGPEGSPQQRFFQGADRLVIGPARRQVKGCRRFGQKALPGQLLQAQIHLIPRTGGIGLIRGIAVPGGVQRQNLPDGHPALVQQFQPLGCRRPQIPHPVGGWQRRHRQQNTCFFHFLHLTDARCPGCTGRWSDRRRRTRTWRC